MANGDPGPPHGLELSRATLHSTGPRRAGARWAAPALGGAALLAGAFYVRAVDPARAGPYPACPFHRLTGLWCPGCGMTRAFHHLLTGDVFGALSTNALLPLVLVLGGCLAATLVWPALTGRRFTPLNRVPAMVWAGLVVLTVAYGVLRNLPVAPFASLAP